MMEILKRYLITTRATENISSSSGIIGKTFLNVKKQRKVRTNQYLEILDNLILIAIAVLIKCYVL